MSRHVSFLEGKDRISIFFFKLKAKKTSKKLDNFFPPETSQLLPQTPKGSPEFRIVFQFKFLGVKLLSTSQKRVKMSTWVVGTWNHHLLPLGVYCNLHQSMATHTNTQTQAHSRASHWIFVIDAHKEYAARASEWSPVAWKTWNLSGTPPQCQSPPTNKACLRDHGSWGGVPLDFHDMMWNSVF